MDAVRTEVMRNRFAAIAEEASNVAYRTAYTTLIKQTQDYQVAMASLDGEFFAYPLRRGVTSSVCQNTRGLVDAIGIDTLRPGDVIITNDPFSADALCTHSMDIHLLMPAFREGRPVAFGWAFIHASDIGGSVPGSISPRNYEVFQEGIRMRPNLLYRGGVLNEQLWNTFADNSRIPELIWGDLQAMLAGLRLLDRRAQEICDRYGSAEFLESIADVIALSELKARQAIGRLTDGTYEFCDYLENYNDPGHIFISARMTVAGEEVVMDFTGSDPQVALSLNFTTGSRPHPFLCMPLLNWIQTVMPTMPRTGGMIRPITTHAPVGTFMNACFPAAMGNRWVAAMRVYDAILGCLNQAVPGGVAAAGAGQSAIISASAVNRRTGRRVVSVVEPIIGGSGGRNGSDGMDGTDQPVAFLQSASVEVTEVEAPVIVRHFAFEPDSAAPGRFRGGHATRIDLESRVEDLILSVRGMERFHFEPWGHAGGQPGRTARAVLNPGTEKEAKLGKIDALRMTRGDVVRMVSPAGGGFGPASERAADSIRRDVADGLVSETHAAACYGPRAAPAASAFGPFRTAIEAKWPLAASQALATAFDHLPPVLRTQSVTSLRAVLDAEPGPVTPERLRAAAAES